ncbi:MAG: MarR family transcriptional regulator [Caldilineaceae bacterium]|nr:MarR family transcriptional regulator [Caldilineaceae bacterium]
MKPTTLYNSLRETIVYLEVGGSDVLAQFDLSIAHYDLLRLLSTEQGQRMGVLCDRLLCDNSKMTRMVDQLEGRGLVQRRRDEEDRRAWLVRLTDAGDALRAQALTVHEDYLQQVFATLSDDDQRTLGDLLAHVRQQAKSRLS